MAEFSHFKKVFVFVLFLTFYFSLAGIFSFFPPVFAVVDSDSDGLSDEEEILVYRTDPTNPDTDGDGYTDGLEVKNGYSPLVPFKKMKEADFDGDGLPDGLEIAFGADPTNPDTDGDGYTDGLEVKNGYSPVDPQPVKIAKKIAVDLAKQRLSYFLGNVELDSFLISSGLPKTPTPAGSFEVLTKRPTVNYAGPGYNYPGAKWNLMFKKGKGLNYYIHGAYWHDKFGQPMSHGCVNVSYQDMPALYDWAEKGTTVVIK